MLSSVVRQYTDQSAVEYKDFNEWNPDPKIHVRREDELCRNGY